MASLNSSKALPGRQEASGSAKHRLVVAAGAATQGELLHARLAPIVNRLVWTFLGPDPERDDVAHDIFVKILRGARSVRDPAQLEGWAVRVAMNAIKNEFRRRKLRRFLSLDTTEGVEHPKVHPDFEGREVLRRTQRVLEALPIAERLAVTLRLFEQASAERIADVCGYSVRTAKRRLKLGRERFLRLARLDPVLATRLTHSFTEQDDG